MTKIKTISIILTSEEEKILDKANDIIDSLWVLDKNEKDPINFDREYVKILSNMKERLESLSFI